MPKPYLTIDILSKTYRVSNLELTFDKKATFLNADASASATTLTVKSITGFSGSKILLIGEWGQEDSEIIKMSSATGTTITLASALTYAHNQGTKVYLLDFNQVEFSRATTAAGTKTVLTTIALQPDQLETIYRDSTNTTGYGFARFKDDINTLYSPYSSATPYTGWATNQVGHLINYALRKNKTGFTENVTYEFCLDEINACLKYMHGKLKKWHRLMEFDYDLGDTSRGENTFACPDNMWGYSPKSVLQIHIQDKAPLVYKDEREWNEMLENVNQTTLSANASAGDTEITLGTVLDLDGSTVMCEGQEITFETRNTTTNVIAGIPASGTGAITADLTSGSKVWQGDYEEGNPAYFTVKEGYAHIWPLVDVNMTSRNVWLDYWKEAPEIDEASDTLDQIRYDIVKYWLTAAIRTQLKNDGIRDDTDGDYIMFERMLKDALFIELNSRQQKYGMEPKINEINY